MTRRALLVASLCFGLGSSGTAQTLVRGRVLHAGGAVPIAGAEILAQPGTAAVRSDFGGRFEIPGLTGNQVRLLVRRIGFEPVTRDVVLDSAIVTLEIQLVPSPVSLDPITSTATPVSQSLIDVPAAISVADTMVIRTGRTMAVSEVLRSMPGVFAASRYGTDDAALGIRGSQIRWPQAVRGIAILVDGVPLTEPDGVGRLDQIEMAAARQVEVVRGPVSALYSSSSGGVVNVISRSGRESPGAVLRAQAGTPELGKYDGWAGAAMAEDLGNIFAAGSYTWSRGYRAHSEARIIKGQLRADRRWDDGTRLWVDARFSDVRSNLPGSLTQQELDANPDAAAPQAVSFGFGRDETRFRLGGQVEHAFTQSDLAGNLYFTTRTFEFPLAGPIINPTLSRWQGGVRYRIRSFASGALEVVLGADGDLLSGPINVWMNQGGERGPLVQAGTISVRSLAPYAQGVWHAQRDLDLTLGVRYENVRYNTFNEVPGGYPEQELVVDQVSPKATLSWRLAGQSTIYGSIARGFEVPATGELGQIIGGPLNPLRPKSLWNYEAGGRAVLGAAWLVDAALFYSDVTGEFIPRSSGGVSIPENASSSRNIGLELSVTARPAPWLDATGSYSLSDTKLLEYKTTVYDEAGTLVEVDYSGNTLPGIPRHRATAGLRARPASGLEIGAQAEWQSLLFVESGNAESGELFVPLPEGPPEVVPFRAVPSRALVSADVRWSRAGFTLFATVENIGARRYAGNLVVNDADGRFYEAGPGRVISAGASVDLFRPSARR